jgi:hypothetical protein
MHFDKKEANNKRSKIIYGYIIQNNHNSSITLTALSDE